jgi:hypothetical protein
VTVIFEHKTKLGGELGFLSYQNRRQNCLGVFVLPKTGGENVQRGKRQGIWEGANVQDPGKGYFRLGMLHLCDVVKKKHNGPDSVKRQTRDAVFNAVTTCLLAGVTAEPRQKFRPVKLRYCRDSNIIDSLQD